MPEQTYANGVIKKTYFWFKIVVVPLIFDHAIACGLSPSRKSRPEEEFNKVRATVVFGYVGVVLKVPGTT